MKTERMEPAWYADLGNGSYRNPILYADYSDPDVIRVGKDFYMTASSFAHSPGLPLLHSKDLVNWTIIGYALDQVPGDCGRLPIHGDGVWAPSLRYHEGKYWIYYGDPDRGIYVLTAEEPSGPWSKPHLMKQATGWIDSCPFWDDDGQAYLVHAFANSRCRIKSKLQICRMAPDGMSLLDEGRIVFDGTEAHPTIEGPKLYKRNGYYYLLAPAGGVATGWQTVLRSKHIMGPYEDKIVMQQGDTPVNGPHQGGYVELESGESWFIHFQDRGAYGRIVHLQPMNWVDDWPIIGVDKDGDGIGEPVQHYAKPNVGAESPFAVPVTGDDFTAEALGYQWQWEGNQQPGWYSLTEGRLRLFARALPEGADVLRYAPNVLGQKFPAPAFTATVKLILSLSSSEELAGMVVLGRSYRYLALRQAGDTVSLSLRSGKPVDQGIGETVDSELSLPPGVRTVYLQVRVREEAVCSFFYSLDNKEYAALGEAFPAVKGHWVGAKIGLFCLSLDQSPVEGYMDVDWFKVDNDPARGINDEYE